MTTRTGAPRTIRGLARSGITHVVGLPDNASGPLFDEVVRHSTIRPVPVTREGEAFAIASGLWLGSASPLVVVQNTGLLESGDSLRGTVLRMGAPIPVLVTGRGYAKTERAGIPSGADRTFDTGTVDALTRPDVDSAALLTEATLEAWGVPYTVCRGEDDPVPAIESLVARTLRGQRTAALVLARTLT